MSSARVGVGAVGLGGGGWEGPVNFQGSIFLNVSKKYIVRGPEGRFFGVLFFLRVSHGNGGARPRSCLVSSSDDWFPLQGRSYTFPGDPNPIENLPFSRSSVLSTHTGARSFSGLSWRGNQSSQNLLHICRRHCIFLF